MSAGTTGGGPRFPRRLAFQLQVWLGLALGVAALILVARSIDFRLLETDEDGMPTLDAGPIAGVAGPRPLDVARLQNVLADLIACRELLDAAMKDG